MALNDLDDGDGASVNAGSVGRLNEPMGGTLPSPTLRVSRAWQAFIAASEAVVLTRTRMKFGPESGSFCKLFIRNWLIREAA